VAPRAPRAHAAPAQPSPLRATPPASSPFRREYSGTLVQDAYSPYAFARLHACFQNLGKQLLQLGLRKMQQGIADQETDEWASWDEAARHIDAWVTQWGADHPVRRRRRRRRLHPCPLAMPRSNSGTQRRDPLAATAGRAREVPDERPLVPLQAGGGGDARAGDKGAPPAPRAGAERAPLTRTRAACLRHSTRS
jgi:hypothetical protein